MSEPDVAAKGAWGRVIWAQEGSAKRFFDDQSKLDQAKLGALFSYVAVLGTLFRNPEKFKKVGSIKAPGEHQAHTVHEFKSFQLRFLGEFRNREFLIAHGLRKKKDDLNPADLTKAAEILSKERAAKEKTP